MSTDGCAILFSVAPTLDLLVTDWMIGCSAYHVFVEFCDYFTIYKGEEREVYTDMITQVSLFQYNKNSVMQYTKFLCICGVLRAYAGRM